MPGIGLWRVSEDGAPGRLASSPIGLEQDLESWIEHDPGLLERGLVIVARQLRTEAGPLDLLALDPQGRWVLIEIKRERLRREVIAQAIDYASCLDRIESERFREHCDAYLGSNGGGTLDGLLRERGCSLDDDATDMEVVIYLVGTGVDPGLDRMVGYLSDTANLSIRVVTFSVFDNGHGGKLLAREIHERAESDAASSSATRSLSSVPSESELLAKADENRIGTIVRPIFEAAIEAGLHPRRNKRGFMIAPPQNKTRCLFYLPVDRPERQRGGKLGVYVSPEAFEQFFGISETEVERTLGESGWCYLDEVQAREFAAHLTSLVSGSAESK